MCRFFVSLSVLDISTLTDYPLLSSPCLHLWRAADKDCASKCLMNKACVMERQTLCVREVLCLLSFQGLSITRHTHKVIQK